MDTGTFRRSSQSAIAILGCLIGQAALAQTEPTVSVVGPTTPVAEGSTFAVNVDINGVSDLYGFQFDLGFNPSVLSAMSSNEGPFLPGGGATFFIPGTIDNVGGSVANNADTLLTAISGVNGSGLLATIDFRAIGPGASTLDLGNVTLLNSSLNPIATKTVDGSVTVSGRTSVPEPSTLALLTLGLAATGIARRRPVPRRSESW